MKVSGSNSIPAERERLYHLLQDPEVLARCMPGCKALVKIAEDTYQMQMSLSLASIGGLFDGTIRIADQSPPDSFRLIVEARGKIGFMKGNGLLKLTPNGSSTEVSYDGDVNAGGTIAAVGQRLMDTTAKVMIKRFFSCLSESVIGDQGAEKATES